MTSNVILWNLDALAEKLVRNIFFFMTLDLDENNNQSNKICAPSTIYLFTALS